MTALTKQCMTVDEYLAWAIGQPGRYELFQGEVFAMSPETVGHAQTKGNIYSALAVAIGGRGVPCHVLPDGVTVRIDEHTAYEPDALVYCGEQLAPSAVEVPNPVVIVEVLSPSTRRIDVSAKLTDYFRLPSVVHYLIINLVRRLVVHHARTTGDTILTRIVREGIITLDPPGLEIGVNDIFAA